MTFVIAHGPPGLEAVHTWNGGLALNVQGGAPRIKLDRLTGYHSLPDADDFNAPFTARRGIRVYPGYERAKTITYEGRIFARSMEEMRRWINVMRASFRGRSEEYEMRVAPADGVHWFYVARVMSLNIDDEQTQGPWYRTWQRGFQLDLRQSDPRFYVDTLINTGALAAGTHAVNVEGSADTDPTISVAVPSGTPTVTLTNGSVLASNGLAARLRFLEVPSGILTVDFRNRAAHVGGNDVSAALDFDYSSWWDENIPGLIPGSNALGMYGATNFSVSFRAAA